MSESGATSSELTRHINEICSRLSALTDASSAMESMPAIHDDHSKIAEKYRDLVAAMRDPVRSPERAKLFEGLIAFIALHFAVENALMKSVGYPQRSAHAEQHASFIANASARSSQVKRGELTIEELVLYVGHWLVGHVLLADKLFEEFLTGISDDQSGA